MLSVTVLLTTVLVVALLFFLQLRYCHILQYLFFLRFPLMAGFALLAAGSLPRASPQMFENMFVLRPGQIASVIFFGVLLAWTVAATGLLIVGQVSGGRYHLPFFRAPDERRDRLVEALRARLPRRVVTYYSEHGAGGLLTALATLMVLPLASALVARSPAAPLWTVAAVTVALVAAMLLRSFWMIRFRGRYDVAVDLVVSGAVKFTPDKLLTALGSRPPRPHERAMGFASLTLVVYLAVAEATRPDVALAALDVPALAYVILLVTLGAWILSAASVTLDLYRVPVLVTLVMLAGVMYVVADSDHYYDLREVAQPGADAFPSPRTHLQEWLAEHPPERHPVITIVAASGGGIRASAWTTTVLTELQRTIPGFAESLLLVSSVSGGSVGGMYYINAFDPVLGRPPDHLLDSIVAASSASSLSAAAWGITVPDFRRAITGGLLPLRASMDRGWALEERWKRAGPPGVRPDSTTLGDWSRDVRTFARPVQIFNATLTESGERFLMGSVDLRELSSVRDTFGVRSLLSIHDGYDLEVATAARLSATFPYVTPVARAKERDRPRNPDPTFHVADGGYYDNFGMATVLEYLREVHEVLDAEGAARRILLIEIQSGPGASYGPDSRQGWLAAVAGPLRTMMRVRESSQPVRNRVELCLLQDLWRLRGHTLHSVPFILETPGPLSWHLTAAEREAIAEGWLRAATRIDEVRKYFDGQLDAIVDGCVGTGPDLDHPELPVERTE